MEQANTREDFETRYEYLRPAQLIERRQACPLVIVPVGPLEYHGPHLPVGVDAINCTQVAHACCRKLGRGVVLPTMMMGTERERGPEMLEPLGFEPGTYVVGMDFPSRLWNSHYLPEEIFAIRLRAELQILIGQGYRYILIANGHGAAESVGGDQPAVHRVEQHDSRQARFSADVGQAGAGGQLGRRACRFGGNVDHHALRPRPGRSGALPPPEVPIHSWEFSIVDGVGFTPQYHADRVVRNDPRKSTPEEGRQLFEETLDELVAAAEQLMSAEKK